MVSPLLANVAVSVNRVSVPAIVQIAEIIASIGAQTVPVEVVVGEARTPPAWSPIWPHDAAYIHSAGRTSRR
jgi:hypothetical protein